MINFTIPSSNDMKSIRETQRSIEGYFGIKRITDYAVLKGAGTKISNFDSNKVYPYWLKTETDDYTDHDDLYYGISPAQAVEGGMDHYAYPEDTTVGTRLMVDYMIVSEHGKKIKRIKSDNGTIIDVVKFGNYPQSLATDQEQEMLTSLKRQGLLKETGITYSYNIGTTKSNFTIDQDREYIYDNQRYVYVKVHNPDPVLPNGMKPTKEYYWVKLQPIIWYVNHNERIAITKKIIIGGVPFDKTPSNGIGYTYLGRFINEIFSKDFNQNGITIPNNKTTLSNDVINGIKTARKDNPEIDSEFGKIFDTEVVKEQDKKKQKGILVKVIKKRKNQDKDV